MNGCPKEAVLRKVYLCARNIVHSCCTAAHHGRHKQFCALPNTEQSVFIRRLRTFDKRDCRE
ncbi:hypothetical protein BaRGS_00017928, partial [Batillaria attramentaria]